MKYSRSWLKALDKSIEHWWENLTMLQLNKLSGSRDLTENIYIRDVDCACCMYDEKISKDAISFCEKCIIAIETQENDCEGTPYYKVKGWVEGSFDIKPSYTEGYKVISEQLECLIKIRENVND